MRLALVTPTGDRPLCFRLMRHWLSRQTDSDFAHVVVDDGKNALCEEDLDGVDVYVRRSPLADDPSHTLSTNLATVIENLRAYDGIAFAEDDEYFHPRYVERVKAMLEKGDLVGERKAKYYHLFARKWIFWNTHKHCSLCRTAMSTKHLDKLVEHCASPDPSVDMRLWDDKRIVKKYVEDGRWYEVLLTVSMKGMPGRVGKGGWHWEPARLPSSYQPDPDMKMFRAWLGVDAATYCSLLEDVRR